MGLPWVRVHGRCSSAALSKAIEGATNREWRCQGHGPVDAARGGFDSSPGR